MQELAQERAQALESAREAAPAPEPVLGTAQALEVALELAPAQKLVPPLGWMPVLVVLGPDPAPRLVLALAPGPMPPRGWMSEAGLELALAAKLVSERALELETGLQEERRPTWLPCPSLSRDREPLPAREASPRPSTRC